VSWFATVGLFAYKAIASNQILVGELDLELNNSQSHTIIKMRCDLAPVNHWHCNRQNTVVTYMREVSI